jgi:hypothetical protein
MKKATVAVFLLLSVLMAFGRNVTDQEVAIALKRALRARDNLSDTAEVQVSSALATGKDICIEYRANTASGQSVSGLAVYRTEDELVFLDNSWIWERACLSGKYGQRRNGKDLTPSLNAALAMPIPAKPAVATAAPAPVAASSAPPAVVAPTPARPATAQLIVQPAAPIATPVTAASLAPTANAAQPTPPAISAVKVKAAPPAPPVAPPVVANAAPAPAVASAPAVVAAATILPTASPNPVATPSPATVATSIPALTAPTPVVTVSPKPSSVIAAATTATVPRIPSTSPVSSLPAVSASPVPAVSVPPEVAIVSQPAPIPSEPNMIASNRAASTETVLHGVTIIDNNGALGPATSNVSAAGPVESLADAARRVRIQRTMQ